MPHSSPDRPEILDEPAALESAQTTERLPAANPASPQGRESIARAADLLRRGQTVAFPTETVYGLGADALNPAAIARIFAAKQRPSWDPLIVHIPSLAHLAQVADLSRLPQPVGLQTDLQRRIDKLAEAFWPGPLTLLLPRSAAVPSAVTAGRDRVGVRIPSHPVALALLRAAGVPLAAPSANRFGHTSPTSAAHVLADLDGRIAAVLDAGPTAVGLESTVLDPCESPMIVYRPGAVSVAMLEAICGPGSARIHQPPPQSSETPDSLPSPGVGIRHYAPRARVILVHDLARNPAPIELSLIVAIDQAREPGAKVAVMLPDGWNRSTAALTYPWGPWNNPELLARRLFSGLRALDEAEAEATVIVCPVPEPEGIGAAIRDRLEKAARPT